MIRKKDVKSRFDYWFINWTYSWSYYVPLWPGWTSCTGGPIHALQRAALSWWVQTYFRYMQIKWIFQMKTRWKAKMTSSIHICTIFPPGLTYKQRTELLLEHVRWQQRTSSTLLTLVNEWACVNVELLQHGTKREPWNVSCVTVATM